MRSLACNHCAKLRSEPYFADIETDFIGESRDRDISCFEKFQSWFMELFVKFQELFSSSSASCLHVAAGLITRIGAMSFFSAGLAKGLDKMSKYVPSHAGSLLQIEGQRKKLWIRSFRPSKQLLDFSGVASWHLGSRKPESMSTRGGQGELKRNSRGIQESQDRREALSR